VGNPRLLSELVGANNNKHLGYNRTEQLRMCIIALPTFISCIVIFAEIFCAHFFPNQNDDTIKKLYSIKSKFEDDLAELVKAI
jgi:hypothetical protein